MRNNFLLLFLLLGFMSGCSKAPTTPGNTSPQHVPLPTLITNAVSTSTMAGEYIGLMDRTPMRFKLKVDRTAMLMAEAEKGGIKATGEWTVDGTNVVANLFPSNAEGLKGPEMTVWLHIDGEDLVLFKQQSAEGQTYQIGPPFLTKSGEVEGQPLLGIYSGRVKGNQFSIEIKADAKFETQITRPNGSKGGFTGIWKQEGVMIVSESQSGKLGSKAYLKIVEKGLLLIKTADSDGSEERYEPRLKKVRN